MASVIYDIDYYPYWFLTPLEWALSGHGQWVTLAAATTSAAVLGWVLWGRRWRADGVRRCRYCAHAIGPEVRFTVVGGVRCNECGRCTRTERLALRRPRRRRLLGIALAGCLCTWLPLALWNNVPLILARVLMPRWVTVESADLPNDITLVLQVDPIQRWLGWRPNPPGAWRGSFDDIEPDGSRGRGAKPERLVILDRGRPLSQTAMASLGDPPYVFGIADQGKEGIYAASLPMPAVGTPGFGMAIGPPGCGELLVASIDDYKHALQWVSIARGEGVAAPLVISPIGPGSFCPDEVTHEWLLARACGGYDNHLGDLVFGYRMTVICSWDPDRREWWPDLVRMRRPLRPEWLAEMAEEAAIAYERCLREDRQADQEDPRPNDAPDVVAPTWVTGGDIDLDLPCASMLQPLVSGVIDFVTTGNGSEWEPWIRSSWPQSASPQFRDRFIREMHDALRRCDCASVLEELNRPSSTLPSAQN